MSTSKGSTARTRAQKHQNRTVFKNDLHDKSTKTKFINSIQVSGVCNRCKEIIEWKIKYKKYKPLTAPKKCVRCDEKTVKRAYHVMCIDCAKKNNVCAKCCKKEEVVEIPEQTSPEDDAEFKTVIKALPERKRRTLLRYMKKQAEGKEKNEANGEMQVQDEDYVDKIAKLKLCIKNKGDINDFDFGSDEGFSDSGCDDDEE